MEEEELGEMNMGTERGVGERRRETEMLIWLSVTLGTKVEALIN